MKYFLGIRSETMAVEASTELEFYLYDYEAGEVVVEPYKAIASEQMYIWKSDLREFVQVLPSYALNMIKYNDYPYLVFNKDNECISERKLLLIGEHPTIGLHVLDCDFKAHNVSFDEFQTKWLGTYSFINPVSKHELMHLSLKLLRNTSDSEKEQEVIRQIEAIVRKAMAMGSPEQIEEAEKTGIIQAIVRSEHKPAVSVVHTNQTVFEVLLMSDPMYFHNIDNERLYVSFPPIFATGAYSWQHYDYLQAVSFNRISEISAGTFFDCRGLKYVYLPENQRFTIGKQAFAKTAIETIYLPKGVQKVDKEAFSECPNLKEIIVADGSAKFVKGLKEVYGEDVVICKS